MTDSLIRESKAHMDLLNNLRKVDYCIKKAPFLEHSKKWI